MASSAAFLTTFLELLKCPNCGSSLSRRPSRRSARVSARSKVAPADIIPSTSQRDASVSARSAIGPADITPPKSQRGARVSARSAVAPADIIPYYSSSSSKPLTKPTGHRPPQRKKQTAKKREIDSELEENNPWGDGLYLVKSGADCAVDLGETTWEEVSAETTNRDTNHIPAPTLSSEGGGLLWHEGGVTASPSLSSRYLLVAMYLRDQGLVLNRAIHRFVGDRSLAEVQALLGALEGLGCSKEEVVSMVQKYPLLLSRTPSQILAAEAYLGSIGVADVASVASSFPEVLGPKVLKFPAAVECLRGWSFGPADVAKVAESDPRVLSMPVPALLDRLLFLVGQVGLDEREIVRTVVSFPGILCYSVDKHLQPRMDLLQSLGFSTPQIAGLVWQYPRLFSFSLHKKVAPTLQFLLEIGLTDAEVVDLVVRKPQLFDWRHSIDTSLRPAAEFLEEVLGSPRNMRRLIIREPRVLLAPAAEQRATCDRFLGLGFSEKELRKAITRHPELLTRGSSWEVESKIEYFEKLGMTSHDIVHVLARNPWKSLRLMKEKFSLLMELGLTQRQAVTMIARFPATFHLSAASMTAKIRFLTETMGRGLDELVSYPAFISLSLDKRLWPRWLVLREMKLQWSLSKAFAQTDVAFETKIQELLAGVPQGRTRHPGTFPEGKIELFVALGMDPEQAARVAGSLETMTVECVRRKVQTMMGLGLTEPQIAVLIERCPKALNSSVNAFESKIRFLTEEMGRPIEELLSFPSYITLSLPNRIRPRFARIKEAGITWWSINHVFARSNADFDEQLRRAIESGRPRGQPDAARVNRV